ncbi:MAG: armadillo-type protein [Monoraphidium minutum]|nr:MAG: armadillo-type protein [Monoraphidium minutum]
MSYNGGGHRRRDDRSNWGGGRGGGGGDRRDHGDRRSGGHHGGYQASYAGQKRGREEMTPEDPKRDLIRMLLRLGEEPKDAPESSIQPVVRVLKREIARPLPGLDEVMIEAVCGASIKTTHLALVTGLVRLTEREWVDALVARAADELNAALAAGGEGRDRARLLARWLACLAATGAVSAASAVQLLSDLIAAASDAAAAGAAVDPTGATWQPWSDFVAYCALAALPWAGADLAAAAPAALAALMGVAEAYMGARAVAVDAALSPWLPGALPEDDAAAGADSGGASFLGELWAALAACRDDAGWRVEGVPRELTAAFQEQLARGAAGEGGAPPLELPRLAAPAPPAPVPPGGPAGGAAAAALRAAYPPRGGLVLLPRDKVELGRPAVERFVAEEYVLDSVAAYDGHRVDLAALLVSRLPLPYDSLGILIETLLGAMARLPAPGLRPVAYHTLLMDVCKLARESPKYMAAWVRAAYDRMGALDPELRARVADYLAHHLSNFQWLWGWERWQDVLARPPGDPQRAFCADVLRRMVGLSYWGHLKEGWMQAVDPETRETRRIKKFLPEEWEVLLGPEPEIPPLPGTEPARQQQQQQQQQEQQQAAAAEDAEMRDAGEQQQNGGGGGAQPQGEQPPEPEPLTPELEWAGRLLAVLRARKPVPPGAPHGTQGPPHGADEVSDWIRDSGMAAELGGPGGALRAAARALLAAGARTPTHLGVMVERYGPVLTRLVEEVDAAEGGGGGGGGGGAAEVLGALAAAYGRHPARLALAADRLQAAGVVSADAVVAWALRWDWLQLGPPVRPARAGAALGVLRGALALALAAEAAAHEEAVRQGGAVRDAEQQVAAAAEELARARGREGGGGGDAAAPRASARVDFALRAEAAAAARLEAARAELERLQAKVDAAGPALRAALAALYRGLAARLGGGRDSLHPIGGGGEEGGGEAGAAAARAEELAQGRALARSVALPSQAVAGEAAEIFAEGAVAQDLRAAVLGQLGLLA